MRRVLILILLLVIIAVGAFVALQGGGGGGGDETATPVEVDNGGGGGGGGGPTPTPANQITTVIATQEIKRGQRITEGMVEIRFTIDDGIDGPDDLARLTATEDALGKLARTDIPIYSTLVNTQLVDDPTQLSDIGSDLAAVMDAQRLAISVPLDPTGIGQVAYALQPGDSVDIIMTFAFIDVDEIYQTRIPNTLSIVAITADGEIVFTPPTLGSPETNIFELDIIGEDGIIGTAVLPGAIGPSEKIQRPRLVTQRIIQNAKVMWVGWLPENGNIYGVSSPTPFEEVIVVPTPVGTPAPTAAPVNEFITPPPTATPFTPMIMVLAVTPQDAVALTWAIESGIPITYALRSANLNEDATVGDVTTPVTLSYMISTYQIPNPATLALPYALEPRPIIRRFDLSSLRRFVELQPEEISEQAADPLREDLLREDLFAGAGGGDSGGE